jgi:hypothetical protein
MSKHLHPDKHMNPELKKDAEIMFNKMKKAFDGYYHYSYNYLYILFNLSIVFILKFE